MSKNFDQFCSRFLSESLRNSWNPERFMRVVPRDLFNEAKILSMVSKFAKDVNQGKMPEGFFGKLNKKWTVALSENGELYISGFDLTYKGQKADLTMNYNAGKMYRFPLQITVEDMDLWSVSIYDENGELDSDMEQFEEAPGPGKIDIPDWSLTIEELKRLGKIGLNNNLNDDSGIVPKDDSRGFADSFSNGKIGNIKINKNITENFDQFCSRFLFESVNDDEYLRLAGDPEKNREELQKMVNEAAKMTGYDVGVAEHRTVSDRLEGNKFDLGRIGSRGGGRTDFYKPAVWFSITSQKTRDILASLEAKGFPPPYGGKVIRAFLKIEEGVDFDQIEKNGTRILGVTEPSRIKSADPVTYDDSGNIIPLSQRFDSSKDDIRY